MAELEDLDVTDANNTARFPEGMNYSAVNDSARALEGMLARWYSDTDGSLDSTGSSNAYALAANATVGAYARGQHYRFEANHTNTGAATLNVDSLGAKTIQWPDGTALGAGDITSGGVYTVLYDGTVFQLLGGKLYNNLSNSTEGADLTYSDETIFDIISSGTNTDAVLGLRGNANGGARVYWDESASTLVIASTDTAGANLETMAQLVDNGAVELYHNDVKKFETTLDGVDVTRAGGGTILDVIATTVANSATLGLRGAANGGLRVWWDEASSAGVISTTDASGGTLETAIKIVDDAAVELYHNNAKKLETTADGADLTTASGTSALLDVIGVGASDDAILGLRGATNGGLRAWWDESESAGFISTTDASGGTLKSHIKFLGTESLELYHSDTKTVGTTNDGFDVFSSAAGSVIVDLISTGSGANGDAILGLRGNAGGGLRLFWDEDATRMKLSQTSTAGTYEEDWILGNKNGSVELHYNGTKTLETASTGITVTGTTVSLSSVPGTYTPSNVVTDRSYDADSTSVAELADVLGSLIADLQTIGLIG